MTPPPSEPQRFTPGRTVLYAAILFCLFFGALELILRLVGVSPAPRPRILLRSRDVDITFPFMRPDPELFWSPRPGFRGEFLGRSVAINSLGLRGPEPAARKRGRRVVCFGDSITFGYGVGDDETYPRALGRRIAERQVEVVNAGVTGYTTHQVVGLLARLAPVIQADVATFCIGWNDGTRRPLDDRDYGRRLAAASSTDGALDKLYLYRAMKSLYVRAAAGRPDAARTERVPPDQYRQNLASLVRECRKREIRPVFVALPHRKRASDLPPGSPYPDLLRSIAAELRVPLIEARDLTLDSPLPDNERFFIDSLHLSPEGHERMAVELAEKLEALGLI